MVEHQGIEPPCLKEAPGYSREDAIVHNVQCVIYSAVIDLR